MASASSTRFPRLTRYGARVAVVLALGLLFVGSTGGVAIEAAQLGGQVQISQVTIPAPTPIEIEFLAEPPQATPQQMQQMQYTERNRHETPPLPAGTAPRAQPTPPPPIVLQGGAAVAPPSPANNLPNNQRMFVNEFYKGPSGYNSDVGEPSLDANENVFFISHNWYAATSSDYGQNWSYVNPFSVLSGVDGGFCCDQKVIYAPDHDMVIWILQSIQDGTDNRYRIVVFRGLSDASTASYYFYDLLPGTLGLTGQWLDFPDVQLSNQYLYLHFNRFSIAGSYQGSSITRWPLAGMQALSGVSLGYWNGIGTGSNRMIAGATDTMYFFGHVNYSTMRVHRWPETAGITSTDVPLGFTWTLPGPCPGPGGVNPCSRIEGGWVGRPIAAFKGGLSTNEIVVMWNSGPFGSIPTNHVRVSRFTAAVTPTLVANTAMWHGTGHITYPSAAVNARGAAGGTFFIFWPTSHPSCYTWITDDVSPTYAPVSNSIVGGSTATEPSSGDYLETRGYGNSWLGACFTYSGGVQNSTDYRAVLFGRNRDAPPFVMGGVGDNSLLPSPAAPVEKLAEQR